MDRPKSCATDRQALSFLNTFESAERRCVSEQLAQELISPDATIYRLSGGQFVEEHGQPDLLGLLQQIGGVPTA